MGAVTFSIDPNLIAMLKQQLPIDIFVETGTFRGETLDIVKHQFNQIYSVELSNHYYEEAKLKFGCDPKINLIHGDSAEALKAMMPSLQECPVIFWLDAHWCVADQTAGERSQCPLLDELKVIKKLNDESVIIIDDARLFLATPQVPHEVSDWPTFHEIIQALFSLSERHRISVVNDCILFFPQSLEGVIKQFAHENGVDWLNTMLRSRKLDESEADRAARLEQIHILNALLQKRVFYHFSLNVLARLKLRLKSSFKRFKQGGNV